MAKGGVAFASSVGLAAGCWHPDDLANAEQNIVQAVYLHELFYGNVGCFTQAREGIVGLYGVPNPAEWWRGDTGDFGWF